MNNKSVRMIVSISLNAVIIVLGIWIIFSIGTTGYSFGRNIFDEKAVSTSENAREVEMTIEDKVEPKQLARQLYNLGLTEDEQIMYFQIILSDYKDRFVGGTYHLNTGMKPSEMFQMMCPETSEENE